MNSLLINSGAMIIIGRIQHQIYFRLIGCTVLFLCLSPQDVLFSQPAVEYAHLSQLYRTDPGTLVVFLRNMGAVPCKITMVELDRMALWPPELQDMNSLAFLPGIEEAEVRTASINESRDILWYRIDPNPFGLRDYCRVMIKLGRWPYRSVTLRLRTNLKDSVTVTVPPNERICRITYVAFAEDFATVYVYFENIGIKPITFSDVRVYHGGKDLSKKLQFVWRRVAPGQRTCAVVGLTRGLKEGSFVTVRVCAPGPSTVAMTRVRVFSDFPVTYETPFAENVFLDERSGPLRISFDQLSGKLNSYAGSPSKSLAEIVTCPMHRLGGWKNAGKVAIARSYYLAYQLPNMVQSCYVCRLHKEAGYFFFGELADVLCINPVQESWHFNRTQKFGENVVQWLTELARLAAAPRSVYTVIVAQNSPIFTDRVATPDEERLMVAYALAGGTKGIIYRARGRGGKTPQQIALAQEVRNINAELHAIKRFIKIGEPMHIAFASDPFVASNAILCGDHAVLLILINRNVWGFGHKWKEYFGWEPRKKFQVHVQLPPRMKITDAFEPATQERPIGFRTEANGVVTVDVPDINLVRTIVLTVDPKDREFDQDGDGLPDLKEVILGTNPAKPGF